MKDKRINVRATEEDIIVMKLIKDKINICSDSDVVSVALDFLLNCINYDRNAPGVTCDSIYNILVKKYEK